MTRSLKAALIATALCFTTAAHAAPAAKQYQSTLTSPTTVTGATIAISKPSKVIVKIAAGNVSFNLKLAGVVDAMSAPVDLNGNTFQVDVIINNSLFTLMYPFDIAGGKTNLKATTANSMLPGGGVVAGQPIEIRAVRLIQGGNFNTFGVAGLTAK